MTNRTRSLAWLAVVLAWCPGRSTAQDAPLYRDPSPTEGPRIEGPLLPARPPRPSLVPPPPSTLGPFQSSDSPAVAPSSEPIKEPLLGISPIMPPLPMLPMPPMRPGPDVEIRRKTTIRGPNGILGQFHEWFHDTVFGPPKPMVATASSKRGYFGSFHTISPEGDFTTRLFRWISSPRSQDH